jgi:hypothetical protein
MIMMAVEAVVQLTGNNNANKISGYFIKDLEFISPLVIPFTGDVEVQISLTPIRENDIYTRDKRVFLFKIYSFADEQWLENCRGEVGAEYQGDFSDVNNGNAAEMMFLTHKDRHHTARASVSHTVDPKKFYSNLQQRDYDFGASFRSLQNAGTSTHGVLADVRLSYGTSDTGSLSIHPTTLDGLMQLILILYDQSSKSGTIVPKKLKSLWLANNFRSGDQSRGSTVEALASFSPSYDTEKKVEITVIDENEHKLLAHFNGLEFAPISMVENNSHRSPPAVFHDILWKPCISMLSNDQLQVFCAQKKLEEPTRSFQALDTFIGFHLRRVIEQIDAGECIPSHSPTISKYIDWIRRMQQTHVQTNLLSLVESDVINTSRNEIETGGNRAKLWSRVGENLPNLISGELDPLSLLFKDDTLSKVYEEMNHTNGFHALTKYLDLMAHQYPNMSILEIGAGTGATTKSVLKVLDGNGGCTPRYASYTFTDISPSFFEKAREHFAPSKLMDFKVLDIERDVGEQNFVPQSFDMIIAANVRFASITA